jgi:hypothetical protein
MRPIVPRSDAQIVCNWLNATQGKSHSPIHTIHAQLDEIYNATAALQRQHEELQRKVAARDTSGILKLGSQYKREFRRIDKLLQAANKALARYVFRPAIGYTVITETSAAGLVPDANERAFQLQLGGEVYQEPDAAISLVRLYLSGDWRRLRVCERCKRRWLIATKSHYRFCGEQCRESYYAESEGFSKHRAEIQKRYRQRLKERLQARATKGVHYD